MHTFAVGSDLGNGDIRILEGSRQRHAKDSSGLRSRLVQGLSSCLVALVLVEAAGRNAPVTHHQHNPRDTVLDMTDIFHQRSEEALEGVCWALLLGLVAPSIRPFCFFFPRHANSRVGRSSGHVSVSEACKLVLLALARRRRGCCQPQAASCAINGQPPA